MTPDFSADVVLNRKVLPEEFSSLERSIDIFFRAPSSGINSETGLFFFLAGHADYAEPVYVKWRQEWADRYNCVIVMPAILGVPDSYLQRKMRSFFSVKDFAAFLEVIPVEKQQENIGLLQAIAGTFRPVLPEVHSSRTAEYSKALNAGDWFDATESGAPFGNILGDLWPLIPQEEKKIFERFIYYYRPTKNLPDFGYVSALDVLYSYHYTVDYLLSHGLQCNTGRGYIYGLSTHGHIAQMANKFAPHTFALVVDKGGQPFIDPEEEMRKCLSVTKMVISGNGWTEEYTPAVFPRSQYSPDANAENYYSRDMYDIRNLGDLRHLAIMRQANPSCKIVMFHGQNDHTEPIGDKARVYAQMLDAGINASFCAFSQDDVDGKILVDTGHNLGNNKRLLEHFCDKFITPGSALLKTTKIPNDFERRQKVIYPTANGQYIIDYGQSLPVISFQKGV